MPEKEGIETISELKKESPDVKIIAVSGGGIATKPDGYLSIAKHLGAQKTFTKPVDWSNPVAAVKELFA